MEPVAGRHLIGATHANDLGKPVLPIPPDQRDFDAKLIEPLKKRPPETGRAQGLESIAESRWRLGDRPSTGDMFGLADGLAQRSDAKRAQLP